VDVSDRERLDIEASEGPGPAAQAGNGQGAVAVASEQTPSSTLPFSLSTAFWAPLLGLSILLAAYTGFRLPNLWSATLYTASLLDGFHRRFLVGTLLRPFSEALDYNYWLYATVAFVILGALLVVLVVVTLRARLVSQRFLVVAFFLLPTGGFLFDEVGYLDQLLYLMLFASLWLLRRRGAAWVAAPVIMSLAVFTHEIAILTVIPILGFVALRDLYPRRAIAVLAPPVLVALVLLLIPPIDHGAVARLKDTLHVANFSPRPDALALFQRSQSQTWDLYSVHDVFWFLVPIAVVMVAAFALLYWMGSRARASGFSTLYLLLGVGAIAAPLLLAFAGWDEFRWAFLLMANFFIVLWLWLGDTRRELNPLQWVTLAAVVLVSLHAQLLYFDGYEPRSLRPSAIRELRTEIQDGTLFEIPRR
jgi:hypothetical protein